MYTQERFPPHLQYVATLPCESQKFKNVTDFDSILSKLLTCSWGEFSYKSTGEKIWKSVEICQSY